MWIPHYLKEEAVSRRNRDLTAHLLINLVFVCVLLVGLWRGEAVWDASIRLPNLLVLLVIINTLIIFRKSFSLPMKKADAGKGGPFDRFRKFLADRPEVDECLLKEGLLLVQEQSGCGGVSLHLLEENGYFTPIGTAGTMPTQLTGACFNLTDGELRIRHPGGLGEECLSRWEPGLDVIPFASKITHINIRLVPLRVFGKYKGFLSFLPRKKNCGGCGDFAVYSWFVESLLALTCCKTQSAQTPMLDATTGLFRYEGFKHAFETEVERSERYQQKMTFMLLSVSGFKDLAAATKTVIQKAVSGALKDSLRRLDLSFSWDKPGCFAAVLNETDGDVAKLVGERIIAAFKKYGGKSVSEKGSPRLYLGYATYPSDATHGDGLIEKAGEALDQAIHQKKPIVSFCMTKEMMHSDSDHN